MAKKTIPELTDGSTTQTSAAVVAFSDGGTTFKGPIRPNPERQINVRNQAQLEAELGTDLEIADNERLTIALDDAFTLTKPFKLGLNSALEVFGSTNSADLTYTGVGALFQNTNPANLITDINLHNIRIVGNFTNSVFDIVGSTIVQATEAVFSSFDSLGTINNPFTLFSAVSFQGLTKGLILINPTNISVTRSSIVQFAPTGITSFTIKTNIPSIIDLNIARGLSFFAGDSLVFFDPNSPTGSIYTIEKSNVVAGDLYQLGTDIVIDSVLDNGGIAEFTSASAHGLVVGKPVVLSAFATSVNYNGTQIVTAIPTATTFETEAAFDVDETGNMNTSSLDSEDPIVFAEGNNGSLDSMTIAESRTNGTLEVDGSGGIDVPIIDITPVAGDWIEDPSTERFSVDTTTGLVMYNGVNPVAVMIKYSLGASQTSGPAQTIDIDLHINGIVQTKSTTTFTTVGVGSPVSVVYNGGNFVINPGDTFQLFKDNITNTNNTDVTNTTLLINLD